MNLLSSNSRRLSIYISLCLFLTTCGYRVEEDGKVRFTDLSDVHLKSGMLHDIALLNDQVTVHDLIDKCYQTGIVENIKIAAGLSDEEMNGFWFSDEHIYKTIEAGSYALMRTWDDRLDDRLDTLIDLIGQAQEADGYINFEITAKRRKGNDLNNAKGRYENLKFSLEAYCMGHLIEAGVIHKKATGKDNLFNIAVKSADHLVGTFGKEKLFEVDGHELIEMALMRLYDYTGNDDYLNLVKFFIDSRGDSINREIYGEFFQDHQPFVTQSKAVGQAPRATYLYSGAADVAYHSHSPAYEEALNTLWEDVTQRHLYLNGGIGAKHENEGFGEAYDLPNLTNYTEICAATSLSMWNTRMFRLTPDAKYFDLFELTMYNNLMAGLSLEGDSYFYACAMESDGQYKFNLGFDQKKRNMPFNNALATRKSWFPCPCCPPNLSRYIPQIGGYVYATQDDQVYVNLYTASSAKVNVEGQALNIVQTTDYPWDGRVTFDLTSQTPVKCSLLLRIPGWTQDAVAPGGLYNYSTNRKDQVSLYLNNELLALEVINGYAVIEKKWVPGDQLVLDMPMNIRMVNADNRIKYNREKMALMRGPVLYCLEEIDNPSIDEIKWKDYDEFAVKYSPTLLNGTWTITGQNTNTDKNLTAIPYYKWSNRGENKMKVWIPKD